MPLQLKAGVLQQEWDLNAESFSSEQILQE